MRRKPVTIVIFAVLLVAAFAGSAWENHQLQVLRPEVSLEETLYITSPQAVRRFSLGYTGLMADIYWTRAVQYFGAKHIQRSQRFDLLGPLLDMTTALDPHLVVAYDFGSTFLAQPPPNGAGQPDRAIDFVRRGIRDNPDEWGLYRDLAFIYYFEKQDYVTAGKIMEQGSHIPHAHPFMKVVAASLLQQAGSLETARALWQIVFETTQDKLIRDNAIKHLRALEVDETVPILEAAVQEYKRRTGAVPHSFQEIMRPGSPIPRDPIGNPYKLMPDGHVEVEDQFDLPFISKGLPPGVMPSQFDFSATPKNDEEQKTPKQ
jgi:hypothetical protein